MTRLNSKCRVVSVDDSSSAAKLVKANTRYVWEFKGWMLCVSPCPLLFFPSLLFLPWRWERNRRCVWFASWTTLWWCVWEEAGSLWPSSLKTTTLVKVSRTKIFSLVCPCIKAWPKTHAGSCFVQKAKVCFIWKSLELREVFELVNPDVTACALPCYIAKGSSHMPDASYTPPIHGTVASGNHGGNGLITASIKVIFSMWTTLHKSELTPKTKAKTAATGNQTQHSHATF